MLITQAGIKLTGPCVFRAIDAATVLKTSLDRISGTKVDLDLAEILAGRSRRNGDRRPEGLDTPFRIACKKRNGQQIEKERQAPHWQLIISQDRGNLVINLWRFCIRGAWLRPAGYFLRLFFFLTIITNQIKYKVKAPVIDLVSMVDNVSEKREK